MPRPDPHPVLDSRAAEALRLLSDPKLGDTSLLPRLDAVQAEALVRASALHGTISTAFRHLRARGGSAPLDAAFGMAETQVLAAVASAMRLRRWSERATSALRDEGVAHALIKGPIFAARLYEHPSDRLFTDIDIVVAGDALPRAAEVLTALGFAPDGADPHDTDRCEFKWTLRSDPAITAELHTNLIHSPRLRRRVSVDLDTIRDAGNGDPAEATALLFVACVHAACGHEFDRITLIIDIVQAMRAHGEAIDAERLRSVCRRSGTLRAVAAALAVAGRMYGEAACVALARDLMPGMTPIEWRLVSPAVVLKAQSAANGRVAWRRWVFRQIVSRPLLRGSS